MLEGAEAGFDNPAFDPLAARAIEILITHNEAVSYDDLACALGVSEARVCEIAAKLRALGYAELDEQTSMLTATPEASSRIGL